MRLIAYLTCVPLLRVLKNYPSPHSDNALSFSSCFSTHLLGGFSTRGSVICKDDYSCTPLITLRRISEENRTQTNQSPRGAMCSTLFLSKGVGFSGENPKNSISPEKLLRRRGLGFRLLILSFLLLFYIISLFCKVSHRGRGQRNTRVRALLQAFFSKQQYNVCRQNSKN